MNKEAIDLLKEWLEAHNDKCWYDHHGYCQAHFLQPKGECIVERTRNYLNVETSER